MKTITIAAAAVAVAGLAGCVALPEPHTLTNSFNAQETAWAKEKGDNTITGSALLRQNGGGVVTCAGSKVELIPYSKYAEERIEYIYRSPSGGYAGTLANAFRGALPENAFFNETKTEALCDAQGRFTFRNIADGDWYVTTSVRWTVGYEQQGGVLAQKVHVQGGETKEIVLTAN